MARSRCPVSARQRTFEAQSLNGKQACGSVLDRQLGRLLGDHLLAVRRRLPALAADDLPRLAAAVHGMLGRALRRRPIVSARPVARSILAGSSGFAGSCVSTCGRLTRPPNC
jgi:hypothetical protein